MSLVLIKNLVYVNEVSAGRIDEDFPGGNAFRKDLDKLFSLDFVEELIFYGESVSRFDVGIECAEMNSFEFLVRESHR